MKQIRNVVQNFSAQEVGKDPITMAQLQDLVQAKMNIPDNDDEAFVVGFERSPSGQADQYFRIFISTKTLLRNAADATTLNADGTHKITTEKLPLIVIGCTDVKGKFHLIGIGITNKETSETYAMCFNAVRFGVNRVAAKELNANVLVADADPAIHNGFSRIFGENCLIIMCYAHVMRNVAKRYAFADQQNKDPLLNDMRVLHKAYSEHVFDIGCRLFIAKWSKKETNVTSLIKKSFMDKNKFWFMGACRAVRKDNNKQARFHRDFKATHTSYKKKPLKKFLRNAFQIMADHSTGYGYGDHAPFHNEIDVDVDLLRKGYNYKNHFTFGEKNADDSLDFFVFPIGQTTMARSQWKQSKNFKTLMKHTKHLMNLLRRYF